MSTFIAQRVIAAANTSIESGQAKYRAYFVATSLYQAYRVDVDTILATTMTDLYPDSYRACIVTI